MDISVIVVTYNQESTIGRTLDSILSQITDADFEIVIGDDCSSDGTEKICRDYAARFPDKIVYLRRETNLGVVKNYFDCIARSRGRYLADCAGDDYWVDTSKLQRQYEILEADPLVSLVVTDWMCEDSSDGSLSRQANAPEATGTLTFEKNSLVAPILAHETYLHLCTALYRKNIITEAMRDYPDVYVRSDYVYEDQQILLTLVSEGKTVLLPQVTLHYSVGHDSISHRQNFDRHFNYSYRALRQALVMQRHFGIDTARLADKHARAVRFMTANAFRSGKKTNMQKARALFKEMHVKKTFKDRLYLAFSRFSPIWRASLKFLTPDS